MALLKCEDCGRDVSSKAACCPNCGCPIPQPPDRTTEPVEPSSGPDIPAAWVEKPVAEIQSPPSSSSTMKVVLWVAAIVLFWLAVRSCSSGPESWSSGSEALASPAPIPAPIPAEAGPGETEKANWSSILADESNSAIAREAAATNLIKNFPDSEAGRQAVSMLEPLRKAIAYERMGSQWIYDSSAEGMSGKSVATASVYSSNTIKLGFPYQGEQKGRLTLRRHPRWGNDVILAIEQGQILCHSYGDCYVGVRFDNEKMQRYEGSPPFGQQ